MLGVVLVVLHALRGGGRQEGGEPVRPTPRNVPKKTDGLHHNESNAQAGRSRSIDASPTKLQSDGKQGQDDGGAGKQQSRGGRRNQHEPRPLRPHLPVIAAVLELARARKELVRVAAVAVGKHVILAAHPADLMSAAARHVVCRVTF